MTEKIKPTDIVNLLSAQCNITRQEASLFVDRFASVFEEALDNDKILKINNIGTFRIEQTKARRSIDINTGETIEIAPHNRITFTPATQLADAANSPLAHLSTVNLSDTQPDEDTIDLPDPADDTPESTDTPEPILKLTEEAIGIRSLLDEIQSTPTHQTQETMSEPKQPEESRQPEEPKPAEELKQPEEPKQPDKPEDDKTEYIDAAAAVQAINREDNKEIGGSKAVWISVAVVLALLIVGIIVWNNRSFFSSDTPPATIAATPDSTAQVLDTKTDATDTTDVTDTTAAPENPFTAPRHYTVFSDTVTINPGSRLTLIALRHYGHKNFWVYIYEANRDIISNPNNVEIGTKIRIPVLPPQLVDPDDPEAVDYARSLQDTYVK